MDFVCCVPPRRSIQHVEDCRLAIEDYAALDDLVELIWHIQAGHRLWLGLSPETTGFTGVDTLFTLFCESWRSCLIEYLGHSGRTRMPPSKVELADHLGFGDRVA